MDLVVSGRKVFAGTGGRAFDARLPAVAFIHGAGMDHTVWPLQARWFAHHGRSVMAFDLPGHGRSEGPALGSIEAMADWLLAALDAAGVKTASLVGHSMGALISLAAAAKAPERVTKLALLGVSSPMKVHPDLLDAARHNEPLAYSLVASWAHGRRAHLGGHTAPGLWMIGGGLRLLGHAQPGVLASDLVACDAYAGAEAAARGAASPMLVVAGETDIMTPARFAKPLVEAAREGRLETIKGAGHMMMVEQPDATLDVLKAFL